MSSTLSCSFCGKTEHQVAKLVAGPEVLICDECVQVASRIMRDADRPADSPARRLLSWIRRGLRLRRCVSNAA